MKSLKKWASRISSVIIYGLLICMIIAVISAKINGGTPKVFGYEIMTVLSGSMEPGIKTGSIIAVKPVSAPTNFKKGDVITFKAADNPNTLITHRIIDVQKVDTTVQYITKGDNNDSKDPSPVTAGNVVAEYKGFTIPIIGKIMAFIQSKTGAIYLLIVPGVLMVLWSVFSIWRAISKIETKKQTPAG
ncbi:signal peptidase I [Paenibacillus sp. BSR1-1]|uniref:signal peptidase I SipW n=1 Tax=Paenibacillus sp. BSR1-1 TaxID=3020845 RepID=UPI0025B1901C|nr:signal peptidase I [Paenibacillus sp. BSR1-1]MDN3016813.1 signal peptidase I [Paenibacillus sp. BSR1-1]